jgi:predicted negative regulator of RcsB-dependent stress response
VDRLTRKELKSDKFALEVEHIVDTVSEHRDLVMRYGAIVLAIIVIAGGVYYYRGHQRDVRQQKLHVALRIQDASIGAPQVPGNESMLSFPTAAAKQDALVKAFSDLAKNYSGTEEGTIAEYYLGTNAADRGDLANAEKYLKNVAESGYSNYASVAKLALAQIYAGHGKLAEGEKLIRSVIDKPTDFVSKDGATIALAELLAPTKPDEARKLLEPLRSSRSAISRAALTALANLPQK